MEKNYTEKRKDIYIKKRHMENRLHRKKNYAKRKRDTCKKIFYKGLNREGKKDSHNLFFCSESRIKY